MPAKHRVAVVAAALLALAVCVVTAADDDVVVADSGSGAIFADDIPLFDRETTFPFGVYMNGLTKPTKKESGIWGMIGIPQEFSLLKKNKCQVCHSLHFSYTTHASGDKYTPESMHPCDFMNVVQDNGQAVSTLLDTARGTEFAQRVTRSVCEKGVAALENDRVQGSIAMAIRWQDTCQSDEVLVKACTELDAWNNADKNLRCSGMSGQSAGCRACVGVLRNWYTWAGSCNAPFMILGNTDEARAADFQLALVANRCHKEAKGFVKALMKSPDHTLPPVEEFCRSDCQGVDPGPTPWTGSSNGVSRDFKSSVRNACAAYTRKVAEAERQRAEEKERNREFRAEARRFRGENAEDADDLPGVDAPVQRGGGKAAKVDRKEEARKLAQRDRYRTIPTGAVQRALTSFEGVRKATLGHMQAFQARELVAPESNAFFAFPGAISPAFRGMEAHLEHLSNEEKRLFSQDFAPIEAEVQKNLPLFKQLSSAEVDNLLVAAKASVDGFLAKQSERWSTEACTSLSTVRSYATMVGETANSLFNIEVPEVWMKLYATADIARRMAREQLKEGDLDYEGFLQQCKDTGFFKNCNKYYDLIVSGPPGAASDIDALLRAVNTARVNTGCYTNELQGTPFEAIGRDFKCGPNTWEYDQAQRTIRTLLVGMQTTLATREKGRFFDPFTTFNRPNEAGLVFLQDVTGQYPDGELPSDRAEPTAAKDARDVYTLVENTMTANQYLEEWKGKVVDNICKITRAFTRLYDEAMLAAMEAMVEWSERLGDDGAESPWRARLVVFREKLEAYFPEGTCEGGHTDIIRNVEAKQREACSARN